VNVLYVMNGASGGAARSTVELIEGLRGEVEASAVCLDEGSRQDRERLRDATGGRVVFTPLFVWSKKTRSRLWKRPAILLWQLARTLGSTGAVARAAQRFGAGVIHTNTILNPEGGRAARRLGLPHVQHVRELVGPGRPFRLWREGRALGRWLERHCAKLVANSEATAACLRDWVAPRLLTVVPNGIDTRLYAGAAHPRGAEPPVVAMVGSLSSRSKKHALFLDAASRVESPARFRIYGDVPDDAYARELAARAGPVRLMGHAADPAAMMAEIDVLVHPNDGESFGRIVLEAMAAGCGVVGVAGGGVAELVEHERTGLLAEPDDATGLAAQITRLLRDPTLRSRLGSAARARAEERFSLDAHVRAMRGIYAEVVR
jgi:glycosyltransferase involved in cell wall biosynthesis